MFKYLLLILVFEILMIQYLKCDVEEVLKKESGMLGNFLLFIIIVVLNILIINCLLCSKVANKTQ